MRRESERAKKSVVTAFSNASSQISWDDSEDIENSGADLASAQMAGDVMNSGAFSNAGSRSMSKTAKSDKRHRGSVSVYRSKRSQNVMDIGFLADKFGKGPKRMGWFGAERAATTIGSRQP